ncbi:MAG: hypothetical protein A3G87_02250 [Omnitrophica bacterium RIFCSPLOWO2_12_FULL_50_11]|nr:MAG: hypothetical protein A3G87_02250 [Omnitrophica bacterium RIFCSPLOWO2_12_FULL_50_11]
MGQVSIERPLEKHSLIRPIALERPRIWLTAILFFGPLLVLAVGLILYLTGPLFEAAPVSYEIERFSGQVEFYSVKTKSWNQLTRKAREIGNRIRTGEGADVDLKIPRVVDLRLKPSSELKFMTQRSGRKLRLKLVQGSLLVMTGQELEETGLEIKSDAFRASTRNSSLLISYQPESGSFVSVLDGAVKVYPNAFKEVIDLDALRIIEISPDLKDLPKPRHVTYQEWRAVNEVRDLIVTTAKEVKEQHDLRKQAGNLFQYVFDEGVFYTPNRGYAHREYFDGEDGKVVLRADYDVYPQGSFSGLYFKTRDLDLSKARRMNFELRAQLGKPVPDMVRLELKDGMSIVRGFSAKLVSDEWRLYSFDFNAKKASPISEVVFVFENSRIGPLNTKGTVDIKNLTIE